MSACRLDFDTVSHMAGISQTLQKLAFRDARAVPVQTVVELSLPSQAEISDEERQPC